jgi:hypothetical protein
MPVTYKQIGSIIVGSGGSAAIDFTSIPATYESLIIKLTGRLNTAAIDTHIILTFNGNASNVYSFNRISGNGAYPSVGSGSYSEINQTSMNLYSTLPGTTTTTNSFGNVEFYIPNYAGSTNKSLQADAVLENNAVTAYAIMYAGRWNNTAAINRVTLTGSASFLENSTAYLYGIVKS